MGDLKPLGSEKLNGDDKLKRILELTYYKESNKKSINENQKTSDLIVEGKNGVYGVVKEKDGYYVKKGLNESSLDYIGGMFMKNKNKFNSYAEAFKRLDYLKGQEELQEQTKYILKTPKPQQAEMPLPEPSVDEPSAEPSVDAGEEPMPSPTDAEDGAIPTGDEYIKEVQKMTGKLGQKLRELQDDLVSDDIKYVINSILSAVNVDKLSEEDKDEIVSKFEDEGAYGEDLPKAEPEAEPEATDLPPAEPEGGEEKIAEPESDLGERIAKLEELINSDFEDDSDESGEDEFVDALKKDHYDTKDSAEFDYEDDFRDAMKQNHYHDKEMETFDHEDDFVDAYMNDSNKFSEKDMDEEEIYDPELDGVEEISDEDIAKYFGIPSQEDDEEMNEYDVMEFLEDDMLKESIKGTLKKYFK